MTKNGQQLRTIPHLHITIITVGILVGVESQLVSNVQRLSQAGIYSCTKRNLPLIPTIKTLMLDKTGYRRLYLCSLAIKPLMQLRIGTTRYRMLTQFGYIAAHHHHSPHYHDRTNASIDKR